MYVCVNVKAASSYLSESVLRLSWQGLEVGSAASACGPSSLGLLTPLEASGLGGGVSAGGAGLLLLVERDLAASAAAGVCLGVSLSETLGTFSLLSLEYKIMD